jgi:hypothetical protein
VGGGQLLAITRTAALVVASAILAAAPASAARGPDVKPVLRGTRGDNGWWTSPVRVAWNIKAPAGGEITDTTGCNVRTFSQETAGSSVECSASNGSATTSVGVVVRIDWTPPVGVTPSPSRVPDTSPWYTAPVTVTWSGVDALSGIASCTSVTYSGPDYRYVDLKGVCRDRAGNTSPSIPFGLAFDATPPRLGSVRVMVRLGYAKLRWKAARGVTQVFVSRSTGAPPAHQHALRRAQVRRGRVRDHGLRPGVRYTWAVTLRDAAGNTTTATASAVWRPPVLRWHQRRHARYYNLQLFRGGHKVLNRWPARSRSSYALPARWRYAGHRRRLRPGRYRWYVWPAYGRSARHFGRVIAHGRFKVH